MHRYILDTVNESATMYVNRKNAENVYEIDKLDSFPQLYASFFFKFLIFSIHRFMHPTANNREQHSRSHHAVHSNLTFAWACKEFEILRSESNHELNVCVCVWCENNLLNQFVHAYSILSSNALIFNFKMAQSKHLNVMIKWEDFKQSNMFKEKCLHNLDYKAWNSTKANIYTSNIARLHRIFVKMFSLYGCDVNDDAKAHGQKLISAFIFIKYRSTMVWIASSFAMIPIHSPPLVSHLPFPYVIRLPCNSDSTTTGLLFVERNPQHNQMNT